MRMSFTVNITRRANGDVDAAEAAVTQLGAAALGRWRSRLLRVIEILERDPHRYPESEDATNVGLDLREAIFGRKPHVHRVLFTIDGTTVTIHRVRHAAQDRLTDDDL
ncbi:MAG: hypothetical protein C0467_08430 [Planctomycetaceae bacterium]|nr:hypothetical protein [Planctomycetaceae bacterium]